MNWEMVGFSTPKSQKQQREGGRAEDKPNMSGSAEGYTWIWVDATYLRDQAQRCVRLARDCPHQPTAHELEAIGIDLMQKAAELDELKQDDEGDTRSRN